MRMEEIKLLHGGTSAATGGMASIHERLFVGFDHLRVADDQAIAKADDSVRIRGDLIRVGHHHNRDSLSAVQPLEDAHDFGAVMRVQRPGGLVRKKNLGLVDQRARNGHSLLLATRS